MNETGVTAELLIVELERCRVQTEAAGSHKQTPTGCATRLRSEESMRNQKARNQKSGKLITWASLVEQLDGEDVATVVARTTIVAGWLQHYSASCVYCVHQSPPARRSPPSEVEAVTLG
ncbi:hypothetical protein GUJ93_ZPchr0003g16892 [Zizania palustris]|uniref:Uncharacterized protein n=1 Tax=Zizania palustris TaxID=103762 RepID=A0A8J5SJZ2_ZIZPA|nr:hypothetical protein GUJ93_ZPchr0003g16892 [Zizania palustris]